MGAKITRAELEGFRHYLANSGATFLELNGDYEILRFKMPFMKKGDHLPIVYFRDKDKFVTLNTAAERFYQDYLTEGGLTSNYDYGTIVLDDN